jgi:hypothetical protein
MGDAACSRPCRARFGATTSAHFGCVVGHPVFMKSVRLQEHIEYADAHGVLADIDRYLRRLREEDWAQLGDFTGSAAESTGAGANE